MVAKLRDGIEAPSDGQIQNLDMTDNVRRKWTVGKILQCTIRDFRPETYLLFDLGQRDAYVP